MHFCSLLQIPSTTKETASLASQSRLIWKNPRQEKNHNYFLKIIFKTSIAIGRIYSRKNLFNFVVVPHFFCEDLLVARLKMKKDGEKSGKQLSRKPSFDKKDKVSFVNIYLADILLSFGEIN